MPTVRELLHNLNASRRTDPASSHAAEAEINADGTRATQAEQVLAALKVHINTTSRELAEAALLDRYVVARRLPELAQLGLVLCQGIRICQISKRAATCWVPVFRLPGVG